MSFNYKTEEYYKRFIELQEKLRKSEEERLKLEMKFNEMVQVTREEEQMHYRKLRTQYKRFLEEDRRRQDRNERILRSLERIESRVAMLVAKTERLKLLRQQYQNYLDRVYRAKQVEKHEAKPKIVVDDGNDVVQSYLQNLSSNKLREMLRKEEESRARLPLTLPTDFDEKLNSEFYPYEGDYRPNYANSIADDIMTSIYNKPKSERSPREFNNWGSYGPMKEAEKTTRTKNSDTDDVSDVDEIPYTSGTRNFGGIGKTDDFLPEKIEEKLPQPNTEEKQVKIEEKEKLVDGVKLQKVDGIDEAQVSEVNSTSKELLRSDVLSNQLQQEQQKNEVEEVDGMKIAQLQEHQKSEIDDEVDSRKMAQLELTKPEEIVEKKLENDFIEKLELEHPIQKFDQNEQPVQIPQCDQQDQNVQQYDASRQQSIESEQRILEEQGGQQILEQYSQQKQLEPQNYNENEPQYVEQQQYDETGHSSETQQGQFEGQYDEYGQPLQAQFEQQQFDSNDQPIQQYGEQQQYDENVQPFQDQQQYDESGQPIQVQQYDENGQPIQVQQYDENGQPIQQYTEQQYDENGQPIQQYDETGQSIQQYDEQYGQQYDDQGQYLQQYDESGQPIPMQQYDETGQLIQQQFDETGQLIQQQYDESGQPVQQYDESGLLIQQYDETGQLLQQQYDETGQPIQQQYDETGQPIQQQYDESGQPIQQYDETGQYLQQYDENGQPIQQYDEQQYYTEQSDVQYDETGQVIRQNDQVYAEGVVEQQEHPTEGEISEAVKEGEASLSQAEEPKKSNVMEMLDTDTESIKQETKVSHDSDFDFSNE